MLRHVPNVLTGLRLAAAPATAGLLVAGHFNAAFGMFAFAGLSDAADGYLAKRFGLTTRLGRFLDPAADKILMLALFVTLVVVGDVPGWLAVWTIGRDLLIVLGLVVALVSGAPIAIRPRFLGKLTTALQVGYIGWHLAALAFGISVIAPDDAYGLAGVTLVSVLDYAGVWFRAMRTSGIPGSP